MYLLRTQQSTKQSKQYQTESSFDERRTNYGNEHKFRFLIYFDDFVTQVGSNLDVSILGEGDDVIEFWEFC